MYLYAANLTLSQSTQPTLTPGSVTGELATASTVSGTASVQFEAHDSGSGVYEAVVSVDGEALGSTVLDSNGGHCQPAGQSADGLPAFLYLQPCAATVAADVPLNTTALTNGAHHLTVTVLNAANNSTVVLDRTITVANPTTGAVPQQPAGDESQDDSGSDPSSSPSPTPQSGGVNGTNASAGAQLDVRWATTARAALAGAYGHAQRVDGRLLAPGGAPIAGALVQVLTTPAYEGARTTALAPVRTAPDGDFSLRLPANLPSSRVAFAYASSVAAAVPSVTAALTLTVPARLGLRVTPRTSHAGGTIVFAGTLHGAPLPPGGKQLVLEARAAGAAPHPPWRQFQTLATSAGGRYRATYRFRLPGPVTYEFRAVSPAEADFPYATGGSNVVEVVER